MDPDREKQLIGLIQLIHKVGKKLVTKVVCTENGFWCAPMGAAKEKLSSYHGLSAHFHSRTSPQQAVTLSSAMKGGTSGPKNEQYILKKQNLS